MARDRILILYITIHSGHYQAARALEQACRRLHPRADILVIDAFQYLNPVLAKIVDQMYLSVIQKLPELWDYLYDNPEIVERSDRLRRLLHRYDSPRLKTLLEEFKPDSIACTQAFPCGLVADYKKEFGLSMPLYAIITDFHPHAYWVHEQVDGYVVGSAESANWLTTRKVPARKVHVFGIPIDPQFSQPQPSDHIRRWLQFSNGVPTVLLMGGGQGLGPILETVVSLDRLRRPLQLAVVTGSNEKLYHRLIKQVPRMRHETHVFGHVGFIPDLMSMANIIITKPGGLTTSEALAKGLPMVILNPLPGQEVKNADFLTKSRVARLAQGPESVAALIDGLLADPQELQALAANAKGLGHPDSARDAARLILGLKAE